ncbi:MAG: hypothetical protein ACR2N4_18570 [Jatrophihabitans sp.]
MIQPSSAARTPRPALIDGVDVDAVAAAVRSCVDVDDLDGGPLDTVASYLPGRRVPGVRVGSDRVTVQLRSRWGAPVPQVGQQVLAAVRPLVAGRKLDIVVSDIADPPEFQATLTDPSESEVVWTSSSDSATAEPSSASIIPTVAETPTNSSPVSRPSSA